MKIKTENEFGAVADYSHYETQTPAQLRQEAAGWHGACHMPGEPGYCNPNQATWRFEPAFELSKLQTPGGTSWAVWFQEEQLDAIAEGRGGLYDSMLTSPIEEAVILYERDGVAYIWDGWHRSGASFVKGAKTIMAIVGTSD